MKRFQKIINKLLHFGICPEYFDPHFYTGIEWGKLPKGIDPASGFLNDKRAIRKRWQIENFIYLTSKLITKSGTIVDFGSGSGHLSLPMAYMFPEYHFILVEKNPYPLEIGKKRIKDSCLKNIEIFNGYIQDFRESFDLGVGIHACGEATDLAQIRCIEIGVPYILCPCDIGYIQNSLLNYPRSLAFSSVISRDDYNVIAKVADWTNWDFDSEQAKNGKLCMGYISLDRNLSAEESGYDTYLFTTDPRNATPKNDIICGFQSDNRNLKVFERIRLFPSWVIRPDQLC